MAFSIRGFRNNNPMNIRKGSRWLGLSSVNYYLDDEFCVFSDMKYGLRAAMYLLTKYVFVYHCDTIRDIVYRWAPPSENSTNAYVDAVVKRWNCLVPYRNCVSSDYKICSYDDLFCLMSAMCYIESNYTLRMSVFKVSFELLPVKCKQLWKK